MRVDIDFDKCKSHGMCALVAPDVFSIDDQGYTQFVAEPPESTRADVLEAVRSCPAEAIRVTDEVEAGK
jgi:ferredoxin